MIAQYNNRASAFFGLFCIMMLMIYPACAEVNIDHNQIRLQSLNKATAQISTFEVQVGETIKIGPLYIRPQACRTSPATEEPESAGFIQVWTVKEPEDGNGESKSEWVFSGWMFASSPGLSSMDHAVYDLWVIDCGAKASQAVIPVEPSLEEDIETNIDGAEAIPPQDGEAEIILEESDEDAPVVKLGGEQIYIPSNDSDIQQDDNPAATLPEDQDQQINDTYIQEDVPAASEQGDEARFDEYEEESDPTVILD